MSRCRSEPTSPAEDPSENETRPASRPAHHKNLTDFGGTLESAPRGFESLSPLWWVAAELSASRTSRLPVMAPRLTGCNRH